MSAWLVLLVAALATFRLTRLVTTDDFPPVRYLRDRVTGWANRSRRREWVGDLVTCHWCASGWVALAMTAATWPVTHLPVALAAVAWPAVWGAGAWLADLDDRKDAA